eukprot:7013212-Prymnesium_polylepis.2
MVWAHMGSHGLTWPHMASHGHPPSLLVSAHAFSRDSCSLRRRFDRASMPTCASPPHALPSRDPTHCWMAVAPGVSFNAPQRLMLGWLTRDDAFLKANVHPLVYPFPLRSPPPSNDAVCVWRCVPSAKGARASAGALSCHA